MEQAGIVNWRLVGDHEIALSGALEGKSGICIGVGTGTFCALVVSVNIGHQLFMRVKPHFFFHSLRQ